MKYVAAIILALSVLLPTQASAADDPPPLTAAEVKSIFTGNSMAGNGAKIEPQEPFDWISFYDADGTMTILLKPEWGGSVDSGKWWIKDTGEMCRIFLKGASGKEGCWFFYREGDFYRFVPSSGHAVEGLGAVIEGNLIEEIKPGDLLELVK